MKVPCLQENHPFPSGNGMAVEEGEFAYPKASGPKFEFSDDEDDEDHDDEDKSDDEDHKGKNKKKNGKDEAPEPKVGSCISGIESSCFIQVIGWPCPGLSHTAGEVLKLICCHGRTYAEVVQGRAASDVKETLEG